MFAALLIGHEPLTIQCGEMLIEAGHRISAVVSDDDAVCAWAQGKGIDVVGAGPDLAARTASVGFDWLISAANLRLIPQSVLDQARKGAVNFHDGPLPRYAGLNAPVWALLAGVTYYGVSWHLIEQGIDEGDILVQESFRVAEDETAQSINTKCFSAGIDAFAKVIGALESGPTTRERQDLTQRTYFGRETKPFGHAMLDFAAPVADVLRMMRALEYNGGRNPLACPKIIVDGGVVLVGQAVAAAGSGAPGAVLARSSETLHVACADGSVILSNLRAPGGQPFDPSVACADGAILELPTPQILSAMSAVNAAEHRMIPLLRDLAPARLHLDGTGGGEVTFKRPLDRAAEDVFCAVGAMCTGSDAPVDLAFQVDPPLPALVSDWAPIRFNPEHPESFFARLAAIDTGFAVDLPARLPGVTVVCPDVAISRDAAVSDAAITVSITGDTVTIIGHPDKASSGAVEIFATRLQAILAGGDVLSDHEIGRMLDDWNETQTPLSATATIHAAIVEQVAKTPDATALVYRDHTLTYAEMNHAANRLAHVIAARGAKPGDFVGLCLGRSTDMVVAALAVLKAGCAYIPFDPTYPADRLALFARDSGVQVILTETAHKDALPDFAGTLIRIDTDRDIAAAPSVAPDVSTDTADLAYLIYTSGSTGTPKGVMIEHRNVLNFFAGMDARIPHKPGDAWLAVTSLSFDISVLELFWTLARGFKVVIAGDEERTLATPAPRTLSAPKDMEFSLYYWGNDETSDAGKYRLLLEGAKFADDNGFRAVWTPERHFHAFGGPYPNPSVTGAAVAAVTQNIGVRAGSCVAPLHHPARIAEEWAVIDHLTNGQAGLAIASGWQPDDFVLRPENTPPHNKPAMFKTIDILRKLWAGEEVAFPKADGSLHPVVTQPRPISKDLPIWVTTAGNPETWREAGRIGANVLTHLLGQSVDEVGDKIEIYHAALREAGHDPADFRVTLMLHSYLASSREAAQEMARGPMKDYLRSAAGLIKQYAWAFPAFKKPQGATNAFDLDLGGLSEEELDGVLDFAFERYFNDSGLFGTVEDAMARVAEVKAIGVTEIACLIDFGIATDTVLEGLTPLAEVVACCKLAEDAAVDDVAAYTIPAQIARHAITHLQCTPSLARMLETNDETRAALSDLSYLMIGGEALPGRLVSDLRAASDAHIENMYGPTETTIWSTTQSAQTTAGTVGLGRPIANTEVYVLGEDMNILPIGAEGELWIGGAGVARGYWQRADLTAERFVPNPFGEGRLYRTGDLVRWRADGTLAYIGRADGQVKLRGHRIEVGEIEAQLDLLPDVGQSVVMVRDDMPGGAALVGYVTAHAPIDEAALKAGLAAVLPGHMVPARIVTVDSFPLTPNKKIDRKALPVPGSIAHPDVTPAPHPQKVAAVATVATPAPMTQTSAETVAQVTQVWTALLGIDRIGPRDNFFDLGGHSLLAVQAHRDLKAALDVPTLGITDIFRFPTLISLADRIDALRPQTAIGAAPATIEPAAQNRQAGQRSVAMDRRREMRARRAARG